MSTRRAHPKKLRRANLERVMVAVLGVIIAFTFSFVVSSGYERVDDQTLQVWFFDVGQGDATFIVTPGGKQVLVDAGPDASVLSKLGSVMPFWDRTIDMVVLTHPDADHITGFAELFERYEVASVVESGVDASTSIAREVGAAIHREGAKHLIVDQGDTFVIDDVQFEVLWPIEQEDENENRNEMSVVLLVTYGQTQLLLTGDIEEPSELELVGELEEVEVLKVGHHGSVSSSTTEFLSASSPEYSVISCGEENRYGHPHPIVLERLGEEASNIFRTDLDGDILLSSDGQNYRIRPHPLLF